MPKYRKRPNLPQTLVLRPTVTVYLTLLPLYMCFMFILFSVTFLYGSLLLWHVCGDKPFFKKPSLLQLNYITSITKVMVLFLLSLGSSTEFCSRVLRRVCRRNGSKNRQQQQELSLGLTLVTISILFILCQSVKIVPDLYERFCRSKGITSTSISGKVTCHSTKFIDTLIRWAQTFKIFWL